MKRLAPIDIPGADARQISEERMPELCRVKTSDLYIDESYQRDIVGTGHRNIEKIAAEFDWRMFSPLIVARHEGKLCIIDGQHRAIAAMARKRKTAPAYIIDATPAEAARIFAAINGNVTKLTVFSIFKAARVSGAPWALGIDKACKKAGLTPLVYPVSKANQKPFQTMAIGRLRQGLERFGADVLELTLRCMAVTKSAGSPGFWSSPMIDRWCGVFNAHQDWLQHTEKAIAVFTRFDLTLESTDAVVYAVERQVNSKQVAVTAEIVDLFNRNFSRSEIAAKLRVAAADVNAVVDALPKRIT